MCKILLTKKFTSAFIFAAVFVLMPATAQIITDNTNKFFLEKAVASDFFLYTSVEPAKEIYALGESISMLSTSDVYKPLNFSWNDILHCDFDGDELFMVNVGSLPNRHNYVEPYESKISPWNFTFPLPHKPANCFIEANVTAEVGHGVVKTQTVLSGGFRVQ